MWHQYANQLPPGYFDVRVTIETPGGHSSVPPDHTGIGVLSRIISVIESNPYEPDLTPANRKSVFSLFSNF
jgi:acetylornithine deacetylase/succinyl-diaminopimelate desuccinylase-like protein